MKRALLVATATLALFGVSPSVSAAAVYAVGNPEEAFAQSYATLSVPELAEEWWFTNWLEPTAPALARVRLDIEHPWPKRFAEARLRRSWHGGTNYYAYYYAYY